MSQVAVARCESYDLSAVDAALRAMWRSLGGLERFVAAGQTVLLKPNLVCGESPERAATTHPAVLEALARQLLELGAIPSIGDAPAWGGPLAVGRATGVSAVCERLGIDYVHLDGLTTIAGVRPRIARRFHVSPKALAADRLINVGKLKAHQQLGFTAAAKNLYGCMAGREKAFWHLARSRSDAQFARFLACFAASLPVALNIVDGVVAMEGMGPRLGRPRAVGALLAGVDCVAVDAVAADLIGVPATHRLMLDAARELGLGDLAPEVLGEATPVAGFVFPQLVGVGFSPWRLARGWLRNRRLMRLDSA